MNKINDSLRQSLAELHSLQEWYAGNQAYQHNKKDIRVFVQYVWMVLISSRNVVMSGVSIFPSEHQNYPGIKQFSLSLLDEQLHKPIDLPFDYQDNIRNGLQNMTGLALLPMFVLDGFSEDFEIEAISKMSKLYFFHNGDLQTENLRQLWKLITETAKFLSTKYDDPRLDGWLHNMSYF